MEFAADVLGCTDNFLFTKIELTRTKSFFTTFAALSSLVTAIDMRPTYEILTSTMLALADITVHRLAFVAVF
jgi:hypothetical protein